VNNISCKCPVCYKSLTNAMGVAKHMIGISDDKHIEWIKSRGLSYLELIAFGGTGANLKPLAEEIEKEAQGRY